MTIKFKNTYINETAVVGGPYLIDGPLREKLDDYYEDFYDGEKTFEDCEIKELKKCFNILLNKINKKDINLILSCDLTNQLMISNYAFRNKNIPYFGLYNACASFVEELIVGSSLLNNMDNIVCSTSAHTQTSERQYRSPIEYGSPKPDYSTFTVSSATMGLLSKKKVGVRIESGTIGKIVDLNIKDAFDMGSAMTPAAVNTLHEHLIDMNRKEDYYDLIITGDLGKYGRIIFKKYYKELYGVELNNYEDAGALIYNKDDKRTYAGGSGPSCLPTFFYSSIIPKMKSNKIKRVLLLSTGALFSTTSVNQKKSIPCICHAVSVEAI